MNKLGCIMLIDDNEDDNFFHEIVIREMNITDRIQVAENAFEALDYLSHASKPPELIFLDINMPAMNGWEFLEQYNKLNVQQKARIVIIMLTTSLNPADRQRASLMPLINGFETKPLTETGVTKILERFFPDKKD